MIGWFKKKLGFDPAYALRILHDMELHGACESCGKTDPMRRMMEGGWDGSQIAICECGHRWLLSSNIEEYLQANGPVVGRQSK